MEVICCLQQGPQITESPEPLGQVPTPRCGCTHSFKSDIVAAVYFSSW